MHLNDAPNCLITLQQAIEQWISTAPPSDCQLIDLQAAVTELGNLLVQAQRDRADLQQQLLTEQTARHQAEFALQQSQQALKLQVEDQTAELRNANEQLQQEVIQRTQIEQTLRESQVCLRLINSISTGITSGLSVEHVIESTVQQTGRYFNDLRVIYAILEAGILTGVYSVQPATMPPCEGEIADLTHLPQYLQLLTEQHSIIISDVTQEPFLAPIAAQMVARKTRALLASPVQHSAHQVGLLCLNAPEPRQWSAYEVATLTEVADYLSIVLQEAQAQQERQRAEERLHLLESVVVNGKEAVIITKADVENPQIIFTNLSFTESTGYTQEEVFGKTPRILQGPHTDRAQLDRIRTALKANQSIQVELVNYRKDQSEFWVDLTIVPIADDQGEIRHYVALQRDVSDRKWSEKALLATQSRLKYLLSSSPSVIYTCQPNPHRACTFVSENIAQQFGYEVWQYLKDSHFWVERIHPDDLPRVLSSMDELLEKEELTFEYRFLHQNGNYRWLQDSMKLRRDHHDHPLEIIGSVVDISDRKWAEDQIRSSLQEKEVMLKEIHHRVKNNLQVISSLLKLQAGYIRDDRILEVFKESQNRVRAMALIHEKLYQSEDLAKTDFAGYISSLVTDLFRSYAVSSRTIGLHLDVEEVRLSIDTAIPCGLIINELVSNSLKYAFPANQTGEIRISLHTDQPDRYILIVQDNGVGLPTDLNFRKTKSLGLQLVCSLTKQLQGTIDFSFKPGTLFKITFSEQKPKV